MKNKILPLLILLPITLFGGYGYYGIIDVYDTDTGLYYKAIEGKPKESGFSIIKSAGSRFISNINIYNPKTQKSVTIFKDNSHSITGFLFEMKYEKNSIDYFCIGEHIKNNKNIEKRKLKDKLLIATYDKDKKEIILWSCKKNGENLQKVAVVKKGYQWHIDVKNFKIVLVYAKEGKFKIESFDW